MVCLKVEDKEHLYLINDFIVTHNTLVTLDYIYETKPKGHVLIVSPLEIAKITWTTEIKKWGYPFRVKSLVLNEKGKRYTAKKRKEAYEETITAPPTVLIINQELLLDYAKYMLSKNVWPIEVLVVDEIQGFKSPTSNRFKTLSTLSKITPKLIGLTGTPTSNSLLDLWALIYYFDGGERLGKNFYEYRGRYFKPTTYIQNRPVGWVIKHGMEEEIYSKIKDIVVSIKNPKLNLPDIIYSEEDCYMDSDTFKTYKDFVKNYVVDVDGFEVTAQNAAILSAKLSQMASGTLYPTKEETPSKDKKREYITIHEAKLDKLVAILLKSTTPVIVAYNFKSDYEEITKRLEKEGLSYTFFDGNIETYEKWNRREIPIMLIQPRSTRYGLNFQDGGNTLIWYTLPWSTETFIQTNKRLHRHGQKNTVVIHMLITHNTIDEAKLLSLRKNEKTLKDLLKAVEATIDIAKN